MNVGILGVGEVGLALISLYKENKVKVFAKDLDIKDEFEKIEVLNICIPYDKDFVKTVLKEIKNSKPKLTIIHSTIPIGTSKKIKQKIDSCLVHSPVIGSHPFLKKSLKTFVKYIGSNDKNSLNLAKKHFKKLKLKTKCIESFEFTEMAKLLCTSYYGLCITWHNYMNKICKENNIDFNLLKEWNKNYNDGYSQFNLHKYLRPILDPPINGKIGGHCVLPNAHLLNKQYPNNLLKEILKLNENSIYDDFR
jgi:UDP-N-acetyl-D-mannosaminuronate dehydrogenase